MISLRLIAILRISLVMLLIIIPFSASLANWSKELIVSDKSIYSINPCITSDNKGNIYIVWQGNNDNQDIYFTKYDGRWSSIDKLTNSKNKPHTPVIISDVFNNLHVVWQDRVLSNYNIYYETYYKKFAAGWLKSIKVSKEKNKAANPDIVVDKIGNIHIVWQNLENNIYEIYYKEFDLEKGWKPDIKLTTGSVSARSEEHTSELQSHSFISYAVFCLKKKKN